MRYLVLSSDVILNNWESFKREPYSPAHKFGNAKDFIDAIKKDDVYYLGSKLILSDPFPGKGWKLC